MDHSHMDHGGMDHGDMDHGGGGMEDMCKMNVSSF
jgi:copper transporter 1